MTYADTMQLFRAHPGSIPVLHPFLQRFGRLWVPRRLLIETEGLRRWDRGGWGDRLASMCMLDLDDRCRLGLRCNQIHLREPTDRACLRTLPEQYATAENCCAFHEQGGPGTPAPLGPAIRRHRSHTASQTT